MELLLCPHDWFGYLRFYIFQMVYSKNTFDDNPLTPFFFFRVIAYPLINLNVNDVEQNDGFWDRFQVLEGRSAQNMVLF